MTPSSICVRLALTVSALGAGGARAEEPPGVQDTAQSAPPHNHGNLRIGASSSGRHPVVCLELSPLEFLSVEGCGTGSGFLHHAPEPEIAHFGAWLKLASWKTEIGWLQPRLGAGFAELQVGEDGGGFHFSGVGPTGVETAGPEAGASLRLLVPLVGGTELIGEMGVGAAWFQHAPRLVVPQSSFQPSARLTLGFGF
jgi:hypothetical protein